MCPTVVIFKLRSAESANKSTAIVIPIEITATPGLRSTATDDEYFPTTVINNAVSLIGGLLGVAIFGIIMVRSFNGELDRRLARIELAPSARSAMDEQRIRLAGAEIPSSIQQRTRAALTQAIDESFIFGFRLAMFTAAGLALVSALVGFRLVENR
jgi:hypothetical protein